MLMSHTTISLWHATNSFVRLQMSFNEVINQRAECLGGFMNEFGKTRGRLSNWWVWVTNPSKKLALSVSSARRMISILISLKFLPWFE